MGASVFAVKRGGTVVTCAATSGYMVEFDNRHFWMKLKKLLSSHFANYAEAYGDQQAARPGSDPAVPHRPLRPRTRRRGVARRPPQRGRGQARRAVPLARGGARHRRPRKARPHRRRQDHPVPHQALIERTRSGLGLACFRRPNPDQNVRSGRGSAARISAITQAARRVTSSQVNSYTSRPRLWSSLRRWRVPRPLGRGGMAESSRDLDHQIEVPIEEVDPCNRPAGGAIPKDDLRFGPRKPCPAHQLEELALEHGMATRVLEQSIDHSHPGSATAADRFESPPKHLRRTRLLSHCRIDGGLQPIRMDLHIGEVEDRSCRRRDSQAIDHHLVAGPPTASAVHHPVEVSRLASTDAPRTRRCRAGPGRSDGAEPLRHG